MLTMGQRIHNFARGGLGAVNRAAYPRELDGINQAELEAAMAPIPELADQLLALAPELDDFFDGVTNEGPVLPFHCDALIDGITVQTNWLGELLLHGQDIARAVKAPWVLPERDMLLVMRGGMQIAPAYLRHSLARHRRLCGRYAPGGAALPMHIHNGAVELRERRPDDRPTPCYGYRHQRSPRCSTNASDHLLPSGGACASSAVGGPG